MPKLYVEKNEYLIDKTAYLQFSFVIEKKRT